MDPRPDEEPRDPLAPPVGFLARRREKVRAELERNRRGEYKVPTWVLTTVLIVIVAAFAALLIWG